MGFTREVSILVNSLAAKLTFVNSAVQTIAVRKFYDDMEKAIVDSENHVLAYVCICSHSTILSLSDIDSPSQVRHWWTTPQGSQSPKLVRP